MSINRDTTNGLPFARYELIVITSTDSTSATVDRTRVMCMVDSAGKLQRLAEAAERRAFSLNMSDVRSDPSNPASSELKKPRQMYHPRTGALIPAAFYTREQLYTMLFSELLVEDLAAEAAQEASQSSQPAE